MRKNTLALVAVLLGVLLGLWTLRSPRPAGLDAPGFSALRARRDIDVFAAAPHPVWDQASLEPVRAYLKGRLTGLGLQVSSRRVDRVTDSFGQSYPLENISAAIPGRSGSSILLVAHYDSSPGKRLAERDGSCGAADDGYGVATLLEIAGLLAGNRTPLENGVRFLFTDGEETGLLGAAAETRDNLAAYQDVNLVINLEARGVKGPVVMFETGRDNLATLKLFQKARHRFGYSFAADVWRRMPNGTDLTCFLDQGLAGMNFAVLEDLTYYHTPRDNPGNISLGSLQHYGEQTLPIVRAYAADRRFSGKGAFRSRQDMVYFPWLPGLFCAWSARTDHWLALGLALAFLGWAGWNLATGRARLGTSIRWAFGWLVVAAGSLVAGLGCSRLLAKLTGMPFRLTYLPNVPHERLITWALLGGLALLCYGLAGRGQRQGRRHRSFRPGAMARPDRSALLGAMALNLGLLGVMLALLPGGTFLFSVPLGVALGAMVLADWTRRPWLGLAGVVLILALFVPVLHLFALALTMGALGLQLVLAALPLALAGAMARQSCLGVE